ncbi:MAG: T9SS type A sorting domain-containing protein [Chitinophagaceae bacterium]|jgi:hypothetical protein|nr:T9SS type A sorting domain-containing protein [Chitinophagaceae bacterium]
MKKIMFTACLLMVCIYANNVQAQAPDTGTYEKKLTYAFAPLDKSQISTGFLEERGAGILPLYYFNGLLHDSNLVDMNVWRLVYFNFYTTYTGTSNPLPGITTVKNQLQSSWNDTTAVPIPVFYAEYNTVKPDAFSNNLLYVANEQVHDVPGRSQNPYNSKELYLATPVKKFSKDGEVQFIFYSNQFYTNTSKQVSYLSVDFNDGYGYRTVSAGAAISISYTTGGSKRLKIKTVFTDNSSKECYSDFFVQNPAAANLSYDITPDFVHLFPARTNHSGAEVSVSLSSTNTTGMIRKPFIVLEGYDASAIAPNVWQNINYVDFIRRINQEPGSYNFNQQLDDTAGYDLIFIDYANGADSIQRNARLFREVLDSVNVWKARAGSTEQNVVFGISMGGLVARYALAEITKASLSTGTRLLITHDSPQRGANIPLGLQHFILMAGEVTLFGENIRGFVAEYDEAVNLLSSPAAQQMLIQRATSSTSSVSNSFLDADYRNMISFQSNQPQPTYRFIATSNGSECGQQLFAPYTQLASANTNIFLPIPVPLVVFITGRFKTEMEVRSLPNQGSSQRISKLYLKAQFKLWGLINLYKDVYNNSAYSPSHLLPWDGVPGGTVRADIGADLISGQLSFWPFLNANFRLATETGFVPVVSALDITNLNTSALSSSYVSGISPSNLSRAATFIAQEGLGNPTRFNQQHTTFTARNAQWIFNEMESITPNTINCSAACQPAGFSITGDNALCTSKTYSFNQLPSNGTINWSVSPSGYVGVSVNPDHTVTLTKQQNGNVTLTGTATICGQTFTQSKQIFVGTLNAPTIIGSNYDAQCGTFAEAYSTTPSGATGLVWNLNYGQVIQDMSGYGSDYFYTAPLVNTPQQNQTYYNYLTVQSKNACGLSDPSTVISMTVGPVPNCSGGGGGPIMLRISPNPAGSSANVEALENTYFIKLRILDRFGNLKKEWSYPPNSRRALVNLNNLPQGVYFLKSFDGVIWRTISFIKQ